ncbi:MAG: flavodoxin family protein [Candidatus Cloacimonetes bacterium]|nr:flavodoxin family protein [Candidatus Cloacimonadota bacterium]
MKVIAFNGSPRADGNTRDLLNIVLRELNREGIATELVQVGGNLLRGCTGCRQCRENKDRKCIIQDDMINDCIGKMVEADGILIGSPVFFADITPEIKAFLDRTGYVGMANDGLFARKAGAAVIAVRRAGAIHSFDSINHFFLVSQMIIPGSQYWNLGIGRDRGDVLQDDEGVKTMEILGKNMAWLLKKLQG